MAVGKVVAYLCLTLISLYSIIWDFLLSQINIWTTTTWSNVWVILPKPSWYEFLISFLIWTPTLNKVFASYNILQYLCDFIHVLKFVTISKCQKSPELTNVRMMWEILYKCCASLIIAHDEFWSFLHISHIRQNLPKPNHFLSTMASSCVLCHHRR
jgi:hypothetical protein